MQAAHTYTCCVIMSAICQGNMPTIILARNSQGRKDGFAGFLTKELPNQLRKSSVASVFWLISKGFGQPSSSMWCTPLHSVSFSTAH